MSTSALKWYQQGAELDYPADFTLWKRITRQPFECRILTNRIAGAALRIAICGIQVLLAYRKSRAELFWFNELLDHDVGMDEGEGE